MEKDFGKVFYKKVCDIEYYDHCINCGWERQHGDSYCPNCGKPIKGSKHWKIIATQAVMPWIGNC